MSKFSLMYVFFFLPPVLPAQRLFAGEYANIGVPNRSSCYWALSVNMRSPGQTYN